MKPRQIAILSLLAGCAEQAPLSASNTVIATATTFPTIVIPADQAPTPYPTDAPISVQTTLFQPTPYPMPIATPTPQIEYVPEPTPTPQIVYVPVPATLPAPLRPPAPTCAGLQAQLNIAEQNVNDAYAGAAQRLVGQGAMGGRVDSAGLASMNAERSHEMEVAAQPIRVQLAALGCGP